MTGPSTFSFAISTTTPVGLQATPDHQVGFAPVYIDRRIHNIGGWAARPRSPADIPALADDADRVFISGPIGFQSQKLLRDALESQGLTLSDSRAFLSNVVDVYRR